MSVDPSRAVPWRYSPQSHRQSRLPIVMTVKPAAASQMEYGGSYRIPRYRILLGALSAGLPPMSESCPDRLGLSAPGEGRSRCACLCWAAVATPEGSHPDAPSRSWGRFITLSHLRVRPADVG